MLCISTRTQPEAHIFSFLNFFIINLSWHSGQHTRLEIDWLLFRIIVHRKPQCNYNRCLSCLGLLPTSITLVIGYVCIFSSMLWSLLDVKFGDNRIRTLVTISQTTSLFICWQAIAWCLLLPLIPWIEQGGSIPTSAALLVLNEQQFISSV